MVSGTGSAALWSVPPEAVAVRRPAAGRDVSSSRGAVVVAILVASDLLVNTVPPGTR
ncbi:hypothetical protein ABZX30_37500 [Streptomyces sp. NPDC004542]|uniref:hypothetical protein n=1 Tax=Streptomyces sp. NPDC004542 TaxID=3154281 RepID=UPI00339FFF55